MSDHGVIVALRTRPAKFTDGYEIALKALRACARSYSPARYAAATAALQFVLDHDEIEGVENGVDATFDYCKVARDNSLMRLAAKVDALRALAA